MFSRLAPLAFLAALGCDDSVLSVVVQNPAGLLASHERVSVSLTTADGQRITKTHDFTINGNLGSFTVQLVHGDRGRMQVRSELLDGADNLVGRATGTIDLTGEARPRLTLNATRHLAGTVTGVLAGLAGGAGTRDGATGADPSLPARLDHPIAFAYHSPIDTDAGDGYILEECGAIRRVLPDTGRPNVVSRVLPCKSGAAPATSGRFDQLALQSPSAMVLDNFTSTLYIADGTHIFAVHLGAVHTDVSSAPWEDFALASGLPPQNAADLALGPYRSGFRESGMLQPPYTTLYVADSTANVVWAYPLAGGAPTVVAGQPGACVPLPVAERAVPPSPNSTSWTPPPAVAPDQTHLCAPSRLDTGRAGDSTSDPVLFILDAGHGALRMLEPHGVGPMPGTPGVTTLVDGVAGLQALGYFYAPGTVVAGIDVGAITLWHENQMGFFILYMNQPNSKLGQLGPVTSNRQPGYTDSFPVLSALGTNGGATTIQFDGVTQVFRPLLGSVQEPVLDKGILAFVQRGNSTISRVDTALNVAPLVGLGPHRGNDRAAAPASQRPLFRQPMGLAWDGSNALYVADRDNHAVARVSYEPSQLPLAGTSVAPLVGCPGTPGDVDGDAASAQLRSPVAVAYDAAGGTLYASDAGNHSLRRITVDKAGNATEIHTLFGTEGASGAACESGLLDAGAPPPGLLGNIGAIAFDAVHRRLFVAHADTSDLLFFAVDELSNPVLLPLDNSGPAVGLAVVGSTLYAVDAAGRLDAVDLTARELTAHAVARLTLGGAVTAAGSDGEWLYVVDDGARAWRVDPYVAAPTATMLFGDGVRGVLPGAAASGFNRIGGIAYDAARDVLLISDAVENVILTVQ